MTTREMLFAAVGLICGLAFGLLILNPGDSTNLLIGLLPVAIFAVSAAFVGYFLAHSVTKR